MVQIISRPEFLSISFRSHPHVKEIARRSPWHPQIEQKKNKTVIALCSIMHFLQFEDFEGYCISVTRCWWEAGWECGEHVSVGVGSRLMWANVDGCVHPWVTEFEYECVVRFGGVGWLYEWLNNMCLTVGEVGCVRGWHDWGSIQRDTVEFVQSMHPRDISNLNLGQVHAKNRWIIVKNMMQGICNHACLWQVHAFYKSCFRQVWSYSHYRRKMSGICEVDASFIGVFYVLNFHLILYKLPWAHRLT